MSLVNTDILTRQHAPTVPREKTRPFSHVTATMDTPNSTREPISAIEFSPAGSLVLHLTNTKETVAEIESSPILQRSSWEPAVRHLRQPLRQSVAWANPNPRYHLTNSDEMLHTDGPRHAYISLSRACTIACARTCVPGIISEPMSAPLRPGVAGNERVARAVKSNVAVTLPRC
ncbi:hypothetical protein BaRGS_00021936 [Batillaria attramentaria]|uniref:Uncharacterized protein n=1 Tax=Batillaria attramentaria TaxID=370345 RepID=A0ABD0KIE2_9CAEN